MKYVDRIDGLEWTSHLLAFAEPAALLTTPYRRYRPYPLLVDLVSGAGELPPCALSELDVTVSRHPAPIVQP